MVLSHGQSSNSLENHHFRAGKILTNVLQQGKYSHLVRGRESSRFCALLGEVLPFQSWSLVLQQSWAALILSSTFGD